MDGKSNPFVSQCGRVPPGSRTDNPQCGPGAWAHALGYPLQPELWSGAAGALVPPLAARVARGGEERAPDFRRRPVPSSASSLPPFERASASSRFFLRFSLCLFISRLLFSIFYPLFQCRFNTLHADTGAARPSRHSLSDPHGAGCGGERRRHKGAESESRVLREERTALLLLLWPRVKEIEGRWACAFGVHTRHWMEQSVASSRS